MSYRLVAGLLLALPSFAVAQDAGQPNIVLVYMDNFGWGEITHSTAALPSCRDG